MCIISGRVYTLVLLRKAVLSSNITPQQLFHRCQLGCLELRAELIPLCIQGFRCHILRAAHLFNLQALLSIVLHQVLRGALCARWLYAWQHWIGLATISGHFLQAVEEVLACGSCRCSNTTRTLASFTRSGLVRPGNSTRQCPAERLATRKSEIPSDSSTWPASASLSTVTPAHREQSLQLSTKAHS